VEVFFSLIFFHFFVYIYMFYYIIHIYILYMNYLLYIDTSIKNDIHLHGLLAYSFCFCFFPVVNKSSV